MVRLPFWSTGPACGRRRPHPLARLYHPTPRADGFGPLGTISCEAFQASRSILEQPGVELREKAAREYRGGPAHAIGYVGFIGPEEIEAWKARGYRGDELIGKAGLEQWGETILAG